MCLGEVIDVLRLTTLVQAKSYANSEETLMWGYSHGGCITDRAVEQGAPVQAGATFAAMTDLGAMNIQANSNGYDVPYYPLYNNPGGYVPSTTPIAYSWRSPANFAGDLGARASLPYLMLQGEELRFYPNGDTFYADGALQTGAACEFAAEMSPLPTNLYLTSYGLAIGGVPPDCPSYTTLTWEPGSVNANSWTWPRTTLLEFENVAHTNIVQTSGPWLLFLAWVNSLGWGPLYTNLDLMTPYVFETPATIQGM